MSNKTSVSLINRSDSCSYNRNTVFSAYVTDMIELDGEKSTIKSDIGLTDGVDLSDSFSGYFPRLIQGTNKFDVKTTSGSVVITFRIPIARWIT